MNRMSAALLTTFFAVILGGLFTVTPVRAVTITTEGAPWYCTGHYYRWYYLWPEPTPPGQHDPFTWEQLETYAENQVFMGWSGHLLTLNSAEEVACIRGLNALGSAFVGSVGAPDETGPHSIWVVGDGAGQPVMDFGLGWGWNGSPNCEWGGAVNRLSVGQIGGPYGLGYSARCATTSNYMNGESFTVEWEPPVSTVTQTWGQLKIIYR
jgi:hypothetical protein